MKLNRTIFGDCRDTMRDLAQQGLRVQCCVTSPPYWGLRDYGHPGQIGLESTPAEYVSKMVEVFDCVWDLLADDGVLWLNLGDSYANDGKWGGETGGKQHYLGAENRTRVGREKRVTGLKPKDLIGIPWRVAFALQEAGWWLRQDIIWCLSGGAWVYARTQTGDKPVMVKDLVRLDPSTVRLWNGEKWTRVLGWGPSNDESERLELVLRSGERIGCTGGHQWPTQRGNVVARELRVGDTISTCRLPEPDGCERPSYLTNDALWLIGLYLAEGSRNGSARQLSLCADEEHWLPRIRRVAKHYGGSCTHTIESGSLSVRLYGAVLHALLDTYIGGTVAIDKHFKAAAWRLPNEALSALVQGYLDGDGHEDAANDRWRLGFCRNYSLERDLRTLAARLGATLTLKPASAAYQNGEASIFRGGWRWERSGHWNEKDRGEVVEIRASRARGFWDIAVEDEPHLFALASGVLTHNCKPNPMPESVTDRCTKAHEYLFILTKSERYYWDAEAMKEPAVAMNAHDATGGFMAGEVPGSQAQSGTRKSGNKERKPASARGVPVDTGGRTAGEVAGSVPWEGYTRNRRSVWTVPTKPYSGAHFAVFPSALIQPCILATSRPGDVVLDPFMGSGTTAQVAQALGRRWIGCEINPPYAPLQQERTAQAALEL